MRCLTLTFDSQRRCFCLLNLELVLIIFLVKDGFQGKAQVCRKNPLRPKMLGATIFVESSPPNQ